MPTATLLMPVLNERHGLEVIAPRIEAGLFTQILLVDGGSTDGSAAFARDRGWEVVEQQARGIRAAYREALPLIRGDYTVLFSPDGNSVPERLPALLAKLREGYDMVIVSRYRDGARSDDDTPMTAFGNRMFTALINLLFGGSYTDAMVIYRGYRTALVRELALDQPDALVAWGEQVLGTTTGWEPQLSMRCARARLTVAEIGGDEPARIGSDKKMKHIRSGALLLAVILREACRWRK